MASLMSTLVRRSSGLMTRRHSTTHSIGVDHRRFLARTFLSSTSPLSDPATNSVSLARDPFRSPRNAPSDSHNNDGDGGARSWRRLGLTQDLVEALESPPLELLDGPTAVQRMAIPQLLGSDGSERSNGLAFAAATGSGKTLAYLLPVVQALKGQELLHDSDVDVLRRPKRPRALVLAPTRELAVQIRSVLKVLSHKAKISSESLIGGEDHGRQRKRLEGRPVDVLVATPGRLVKHLDAGHVYLGSVTHVVLDEVDTMLEQGFQPDVARVLHPLLYGGTSRRSDADQFELREDAPQVILTTATLTNAVKRFLGDKTAKPKRNYKTHDGGESATRIRLPPNIRVVEAPGLHRAVPTLRQVFVDVGQADKLGLLTDAVRNHRGDDYDDDDDEAGNDGSTIVFCNTVASCRAAEHALAEAGVDCLTYHGGLNSAARAANLDSFRDGDGGRVLVCTDVAARGLDVPAVDHVVMFDFPLNPLDYLHRAGRTARAGQGEGRVTALVARRDRVLARGIEEAVVRGDRLDDLTGRKTDYGPGGRLTAPPEKTRYRNNQGYNPPPRRGRDDSGGEGGGSKSARSRRNGRGRRR